MFCVTFYWSIEINKLKIIIFGAVLSNSVIQPSFSATTNVEVVKLLENAIRISAIFLKC